MTDHEQNYFEANTIPVVGELTAQDVYGIREILLAVSKKTSRRDYRDHIFIRRLEEYARKLQGAVELTLKKHAAEHGADNTNAARWVVNERQGVEA